MNPPDHDKSKWKLIQYTADWALYQSRSSSLCSISRRVDGDWELNDTGTLQEMQTKFERVSLPNGSGTIYVVNPANGQITAVSVATSQFAASQGGIGYDSFDEAFPQGQWSLKQVFATKAEIEYNLMVRDGVRSPNPPACVVTVWNDDDADFHWKIETEGQLQDQQEAFERFRAAMEYIKPAPVDPYASNPLFGRF